MYIKEKIKSSDVTQWEVAEKLNMSEFTLSRWLRRPEKLPREKIDKIEAAMLEIKEERK